MNHATTSESLHEVYHGDDGIELQLDCAEGSCLAEITVPSDLPWAEVEVLLQPRDERGLPCGPPIRVDQQSLPLSPLPDGQGGLGRFWMPGGISPETAQQCHFRVSPCRMERNDSRK